MDHINALHCGQGRKEMELYFTTVEPQDEKKNLLYDYAQSEKRLFAFYLEFLFQHYVNVSLLIKFSQKTSVFTLIIISSP